ncbi:MAG: sigma-70 family RNA polymerase sigma factor [Bernardetiaceae bacterium]
MNTEQIIVGFKEELLGFVRRHIQDEQAAKDVHQDILIKIFTHHHTLKDQDRLKAWIYQIARRRITDFFRQHNRQSMGFQQEMREEEPSMNLDDQLLPCVRPFLEHLRPNYRQALLLTDLGSLSQKELAQEMNLSYSGAKSTVQRARRQLKKIFDQCCQIEADRYGNIVSVTPKTASFFSPHVYPITINTNHSCQI